MHTNDEIIKRNIYFLKPVYRDEQKKIGVFCYQLFRNTGTVEVTKIYLITDRPWLYHQLDDESLKKSS